MTAVRRPYRRSRAGADSPPVASPTTSATAMCPGCGHAMEAMGLAARYGRSVEVDVCDHCGGLWFDHAESQQLSPGATLRLLDRLTLRPSRRCQRAVALPPVPADAARRARPAARHAGSLTGAARPGTGASSPPTTSCARSTWCASSHSPRSTRSAPGSSRSTASTAARPSVWLARSPVVTAAHRCRWSIPSNCDVSCPRSASPSRARVMSIPPCRFA